MLMLPNVAIGPYQSKVSHLPRQTPVAF